MYTLCHYGLVVPGFSVVYVFNELHFAKDKMRDNFLNGFGQDFLQKIYTERETEKKHTIEQNVALFLLLFVRPLR